MPDAPGSRPLLSVDIDGVLARPPFGFTSTMNRRIAMEANPVRLPATPAPAPKLADRFLQATYYRVRCAGRAPMPGAVDALAAARDAGYRLIALTGRDWRGRALTERWLDDNRLLPCFDAVRMNDSARFGAHLSAARFKEAVCAELGVVRHIDDDAGTAALLARNGVIVDLIDWPRSRGLEFPPGVTRRMDLYDLARAFVASPAPSPSARPSAPAVPTEPPLADR